MTDYNTSSVDKQSPFIDTKMYMVSQTAQGGWWLANRVPEWRLTLNILYDVIIDGLGRQVE